MKTHITDCLVTLAGAGAFLAGAMLLGLLTGCTTTTYTDPSGAKFSRTSFGSTQTVGEVRVKAGDKELTMKGYSNEQTAVVESAVSAAVKAATGK